MKLESKSSVFNMGDTSIRVKQLVEVNRVVLSQLYDFSEKKLTWKDNGLKEDKDNQERFYFSFISEIKRLEADEDIKLFIDFSRDYVAPKKNEVGLRGRTLTNALVKNGFINNNRELGEVALNYLNNKLKQADVLEALLGLDQNNLLYLRQYLKMRIYAYDLSGYFYNFRFSLAFLVKYDDVPKEHFFKIVESIDPSSSEEELQKIILNYGNVKLGIESFDEFYEVTFLKTLKSSDEIRSAKLMFKSKDFDSDLFKEHFPNRKSSESVELYREFVKNLILVVDHQDEKAFEIIQELSIEAPIKKAFSNGKVPFIFSKNQTVRSFIEDNKGNPLLSENHFHIYSEFVLSKHNDLIREYSDMCRRAFQVTGVISFDNDLVNLNHKWFIEPFLNILGDRFVLTGVNTNSESYESYENNLDSVWFQDSSIVNIFKVSDIEIDKLLLSIKSDLKIKSVEDISTTISEKWEADFRFFIENKFPVATVIQILDAISNRNDKKVFKMVTDNATISTIYEYILTIAWYHISDKKDFLLHKAFQVSLDGNRLPLLHRGGGAGDIEIITNEYALLIEATLMDKNTQKRGELEPVIRHSTNFKLAHNEHPQVQTIFVANELDDNVMNIFRATQFTRLYGTLTSGCVDGLNIFPLCTDDLVHILQQGIKDEDILTAINENIDGAPIFIDDNWYEPIRQEVLGLI